MTFIGKVAESLEGRVNSSTLAVTSSMLLLFFKSPSCFRFSTCVVLYAYMYEMHVAFNVVLRSSF